MGMVTIIVKCWRDETCVVCVWGGGGGRGGPF